MQDVEGRNILSIFLRNLRETRQAYCGHPPSVVLIRKKSNRLPRQSINQMKRRGFIHFRSEGTHLFHNAPAINPNL